MWGGRNVEETPPAVLLAPGDKQMRMVAGLRTFRTKYLLQVSPPLDEGTKLFDEVEESALAREVARIVIEHWLKRINADPRAVRSPAPGR